MAEIIDPKRQEKKSTPYDWLETAVLLLFLAVSWLVLPVICGLLLAGLWEMITGLRVFVGHLPKPEDALSAEGAALQHAIKGIEFFLLAPLPYFVLLSLSNYIKNSREGAVPGSAKERLLSVKALAIGLLIAVIATDLVGKILSRDGLAMHAALCETLAIVVLGAYFFGLEVLGSKLQGGESVGGCGPTASSQRTRDDH
jgi:hypothetical protein